LDDRRGMGGQDDARGKAMSGYADISITSFNCPVCAARLHAQPGHQLSATEGVTVFCANEECPAQEVAGHGDNEKKAFEIIHQRFSHRAE